jgi:hypothetical protein
MQNTPSVSMNARTFQNLSRLPEGLQNVLQGDDACSDCA